MKVSIENLQDTFKIGLETFEDSRNEAAEILDLYHNRHYNQSQLSELANRGQPAETYNVIKQFSRMFVGYFSSVINTVKAMPLSPADSERAAMLTDTLDNILDENNWALMKDQLVLDAILVGISVVEVQIQNVGESDEFDRPIYKLMLNRVDPAEVILDPMSTKEDYSDARYIHRFKWINKEAFKAMFGAKNLQKADENYNFTEAWEADYEVKYGEAFAGSYKVFDNYLVVHSIMRDDDNKFWSCMWHGDLLLDKQEIKYEDVKFPYLVTRTTPSNTAEYYGIFREIKESQKAIDQAVIAIQLMVNSNKIFYEPEAIKDEDQFIELVKKVNGVIPVLDLQGIKIENMSQDIANQYIIIDKNIERIQRLLSINDSFLGMANASDSGRKVKLQQQASVVALRYLTNRIEFLYTNLGRSMVSLIKQYYTAHQVLSVANIGIDEQRKWFEINKPFMMPTGRWLANGQPEMSPVYDDVSSDNPDEPRRLQVVNEADTDLALAEVRVKVETASYNDTDDIERVFLDSLIQGPAGQVLMQTSPADYFKLLALGSESAKTRHSSKIAEIFKGIAQKMEGAPQVDPRMMQQGNQTNGQSGSQPGALMDASGLTNFANPEQGGNTNG